MTEQRPQAGRPEQRPRRGTPEIPASLKKDWKVLAEAMKAQGWTFEQGTHVKAFAPDGTTATTLPGTPGDQRGWRNARAFFRRWCRENNREPGI
jgi:hypothetical protein